MCEKGGEGLPVIGVHERERSGGGSITHLVTQLPVIGEK